LIGLKSVEKMENWKEAIEKLIKMFNDIPGGLDIIFPSSILVNSSLVDELLVLIQKWCIFLAKKLRMLMMDLSSR